MENTIAAPTTTEGSPMRARLEIGLILLGLLALLFLMPHTISSDGQERFNELTLLLGKGIIPTRKYSMIGPIFAAPLWLLGNPFHVAYALVSRFNWLLFSTGLLVMYVLLRRRLDPTLLRTFILILIAGSMFPNHLSNFYGEVFTAMFVGVGLLIAIVVGGRARLGGWFAVALGVANTPATLVGLGLIAVRRIWETGRLRPVLVIVAAGALIGAENWKRASPTRSSSDCWGFSSRLARVCSSTRPVCCCPCALAFSPCARGPKPSCTRSICCGCVSSRAWCWPMPSGGRGMAAGIGAHASSSWHPSPLRLLWRCACAIARASPLSATWPRWWC